jgi:hypothetical protein
VGEDETFQKDSSADATPGRGLKQERSLEERLIYRCKATRVFETAKLGVSVRLGFCSHAWSIFGRER